MIPLILGAGIFLASLGKKKDGAQMSDDAWRKFDALFKKYGATFGVDWKTLKAIALNESSLGTYPSVALGIREPSSVNASKSQDGLSWGLMQVTISTARTLDPLATAEKLNDPEYSIRLAAAYLKQLQSMFSQLEWVVKSYNQGPGNSQKERSGQSKGFADEYWARFQRNLKLVNERP